MKLVKVLALVFVWGIVVADNSTTFSTTDSTWSTSDSTFSITDSSTTTEDSTATTEFTTTPENPTIGPFVCEFLTDNFEGLDDPLVIEDPIGPVTLNSSSIRFSFTSNYTEITGISTTIYDSCEATIATYAFSSSIESLDIRFTNYSIEGLLVENIPVYGTGVGRVLIEEFTVDVSGNFELDVGAPCLELTSIAIDLDMYRWFFYLDEVNPDSDFGWLFNEFFTQVGPELLQIFSAGMSDSEGALNQLLLDFFNDLLPCSQERRSAFPRAKLNALVKELFSDVLLQLDSRKYQHLESRILGLF